MQNVHYRFCQFFIRILFEEKFEDYKHFSKSKLAINEINRNIEKNEMIKRDSHIQDNENFNVRFKILKKSFLIWFAHFFIIFSKNVRSRISTSRFKYFTNFLKKKLSIVRNDKFTFNINFNNLSLNSCWMYRKNNSFFRMKQISK